MEQAWQSTRDPNAWDDGGSLERRTSLTAEPHSELWVQVRGSASITKAESDWERYLGSTLVLQIQVSTHRCPTRACTPHIHSHKRERGESIGKCPHDLGTGKGSSSLRGICSLGFLGLLPPHSNCFPVSKHSFPVRSQNPKAAYCVRPGRPP